MLQFKTPGSALLNGLIRKATHDVSAADVQTFLTRYAGQDASTIREKDVKRELFNRFHKDSHVRFNPTTQQLNIWVGTQLFTVGKAAEQQGETQDEQPAT